MSVVSPANVGVEDATAPPAYPNEKAHHELHAPEYLAKDVPFEDLLHYARLARAQESDSAPSLASDEKNGAAAYDDLADLSEDARERINARRALRQASWAAVFYLITTDILGPFNAPYAIASVGYVPGILLYFFMGAIAAYTGLVLWQLYVKLDSPRYPIKTYGDLADRIFGPWARNLCTILQSLQLVINVGIICLSNGQSLSQVAQGNICFSLAILIWVLCGFVIGQIRTLKNFGWLANSAVWINLAIIFISMGFVAHSPPNYASAFQSLGVTEGPVLKQNFVQQPLFYQVNGVFQMVFAYGGAMIFPEIMAEMRRPMDFWKGMAMAQILIFAAYLLYGVFVYSYQGQFTLPLAYNGVSKQSWQDVGNILSLITGLIAAGLYGNIGIKIVYINIVEGWLKGPSLMTKKGRVVWTGLVFVYWSLAFIVGSAIPQVATISGLVAAVCILQFTYTFPPILLVGYDVIVDAMKGDAEHKVGSHPTGRIDTWSSWSRWKRGLFSGRWYWKLFNFLLFLAGVATAGLGMWASGEAIKATFALGHATSFGCTPPV